MVKHKTNIEASKLLGDSDHGRLRLCEGFAAVVLFSLRSALRGECCFEACM